MNGEGLLYPSSLSPDDSDQLTVRFSSPEDVVLHKLYWFRFYCNGYCGQHAGYGSAVGDEIISLASADYWQAWRVTEEIIETRSVDFVEFESILDP